MSHPSYRIMVVDDNPRIHSDFAKIFKPRVEPDEFDLLKDELFGGGGGTSLATVERSYEMSYHSSGEEAVDEISQSLVDKRPYALAFVDIRMPGWDGIRSAQEIWEVDPDVQIVICTAYTDYTWESILDRLGDDRSFLILKKPFDVIEVKQLAQMLTSKWQSTIQERRSFQELADALQAKDSFLARVSHEVRTPLHGIVGIVDLLKETKLDSQQVDFIQTLASCGESLGLIIDDILDFSAIEDGRFALNPDHFHLVHFLEGIKKQFRFDSYSRGIELKFSLDKNLPAWVYGDVTRLTQVFGNILRNAFKFTPDGEIRVEGKLLGTTSNSYRLDFRIIDSGVGIPQEFMEKLFIPFSQAENVDRRRFGGTGLGLSISKGLIESMEGEIRVSSDIGVGTTVAFEIFLEKGDESEAISHSDLSESTLPNKNHYRILAVDDSPTNRKVIKNQLFWLGYECETADSCEEALLEIAKRDFDLVLMDCQMPEIDGFQATIKIREVYPEYERVPIVALSANIDKSTQEKCKQVGMDGFISKPAKKHEIDTIVGDMIRNGRSKTAIKQL